MIQLDEHFKLGDGNLSFQVANDGDAITIYCDTNGLDELINTLVRLRSASDLGHIHMRAPSTGGGILSDQNPWGEEAIGEVIVSLG